MSASNATVEKWDKPALKLDILPRLLAFVRSLIWWDGSLDDDLCGEGGRFFVGESSIRHDSNL